MEVDDATEWIEVMGLDGVGGSDLRKTVAQQRVDLHPALMATRSNLDLPWRAAMEVDDATEWIEVMGLDGVGGSNLRKMVASCTAASGREGNLTEGYQWLRPRNESRHESAMVEDTFCMSETGTIWIIISTRMILDRWI
ncbi:hypothetical protein E2562_020120 [Oryza meyeriana var. granulata]|uniref:Uncharacterized protein n=1 Tax=Oryza meyeriana var. granulata TaxID=110450 RepID=A0A6G1EAR2_9ORYZ|nr:hypothetical protein E2562_020120 [Oryza meyeriana var. granulata]